MYFEADIHPRALGDGGDVFCWISSMVPGRIWELAIRLRSLREARFVAATTGTSNLVVHIVLPAGASIVDFVDAEISERGVTAVEIQAECLR